MADPRGTFAVEANGETYRLWLGMSVLADLQAKHGDDVLQQLSPPPGAGSDWVPPLRVIIDMLMGSLERFHADEADRFLVDDILSQNGAGPVMEGLMAAAFPDQKPAAGNGKRPKRAA